MEQTKPSRPILRLKKPAAAAAPGEPVAPAVAPAPAPEPAELPGLTPAEVLAELVRAWPTMAAPLPLALGVFKDVVKAKPARASNRAVKLAMELHAQGAPYLAALAAPGAMRHALDGTPVEPVSAEHAADAAARLARLERRQRAKTRPKRERQARQERADNGMVSATVTKPDADEKASGA